MSTILDALSRAERERQMGGIPAIERALLEHPRLPEQSPRQKLSLRWIVLGLGLILCGALIAVLVSTLREKATLSPAGAQEQSAAPLPTPAPSPAPVQAAAPMATAADNSSDAPLDPPAAPPSHPAGTHEHAKPAAAAKKPASTAAQASSSKHRPSEASASKQSVVTPSTVKATETQKPPAKPADVPAPSRQSGTALPWINELPANVRQELPQISLGGYIYSANVAERSILINGKLLREGDQLTPDLRLEQMRPDGVVFAYREQRFRMRY